jgi:hypothetical protein
MRCLLTPIAVTISGTRLVLSSLAPGSNNVWRLESGLLQFVLKKLVGITEMYFIVNKILQMRAALAV